MNRAERLVVQFRRERRWTRELVEAVPEEHFSWTPSTAAWSCGGIVTHLIHAELFWRKLLLAAVRGEAYDPFALPGSTVRERYEAFRPRNDAGSRSGRFGTSFATCLATWQPIGDETARELSSIPDDRLGVLVTHPVAGLTAPVEDMILTFFSHESHHRGQLSGYLKMLGVRQPPLFTEGL